MICPSLLKPCTCTCSKKSHIEKKQKRIQCELIHLNNKLSHLWYKRSFPSNIHKNNVTPSAILYLKLIKDGNFDLLRHLLKSKPQSPLLKIIKDSPDYFNFTLKKMKKLVVEYNQLNDLMRQINMFPKAKSDLYHFNQEFHMNRLNRSYNDLFRDIKKFHIVNQTPTNIEFETLQPSNFNPYRNVNYSTTADGNYSRIQTKDIALEILESEKVPIFSSEAKFKNLIHLDPDPQLLRNQIIDIDHGSSAKTLHNYSLDNFQKQSFDKLLKLKQLIDNYNQSHDRKLMNRPYLDYGHNFPDLTPQENQLASANQDFQINKLTDFDLQHQKNQLQNIRGLSLGMAANFGQIENFYAKSYSPDLGEVLKATLADGRWNELSQAQKDFLYQTLKDSNLDYLSADQISKLTRFGILDKGLLNQASQIKLFKNLGKDFLKSKKGLNRIGYADIEYSPQDFQDNRNIIRRSFSLGSQMSPDQKENLDLRSIRNRLLAHQRSETLGIMNSEHGNRNMLERRFGIMGNLSMKQLAHLNLLNLLKDGVVNQTLLKRLQEDNTMQERFDLDEHLKNYFHSGIVDEKNRMNDIYFGSRPENWKSIENLENMITGNYFLNQNQQSLMKFGVTDSKLRFYKNLQNFLIGKREALKNMGQPVGHALNRQFESTNRMRNYSLSQVLKDFHWDISKSIFKDARFAYEKEQQKLIDELRSLNNDQLLKLNLLGVIDKDLLGQISHEKKYKATDQKLNNQMKSFDATDVYRHSMKSLYLAPGSQYEAEKSDVKTNLANLNLVLDDRKSVFLQDLNQRNRYGDLGGYSTPYELIHDLKNLDRLSRSQLIKLNIFGFIDNEMLYKTLEKFNQNFPDRRAKLNQSERGSRKFSQNRLSIQRLRMNDGEYLEREFDRDSLKKEYDGITPMAYNQNERPSVFGNRKRSGSQFLELKNRYYELLNQNLQKDQLGGGLETGLRHVNFETSRDSQQIKSLIKDRFGNLEHLSEGQLLKLNMFGMLGDEFVSDKLQDKRESRVRGHSLNLQSKSEKQRKLSGKSIENIKHFNQRFRVTNLGAIKEEDRIVKETLPKRTSRYVREEDFDGLEVKFNKKETETRRFHYGDQNLADEYFSQRRSIRNNGLVGQNIDNGQFKSRRSASLLDQKRYFDPNRDLIEGLVNENVYRDQKMGDLNQPDHKLVQRRFSEPIKLGNLEHFSSNQRKKLNLYGVVNDDVAKEYLLTTQRLSIKSPYSPRTSQINHLGIRSDRFSKREPVEIRYSNWFNGTYGNQITLNQFGNAEDEFIKKTLDKNRLDQLGNDSRLNQFEGEIVKENLSRSHVINVWNKTSKEKFTNQPADLQLKNQAKENHTSQPMGSLKNQPIETGQSVKSFDDFLKSNELEKWRENGKAQRKNARDDQLGTSIVGSSVKTDRRMDKISSESERNRIVNGALVTKLSHQKTESSNFQLKLQLKDNGSREEKLRLNLTGQSSGEKKSNFSLSTHSTRSGQRPQSFGKRSNDTGFYTAMSRETYLSSVNQNI